VLTGLFIGALLFWLGGAPEERGKSIVAAILAGIWAAACGILGVILTLLWTVTDHRFAHQNENVLLFNPLWLILAVALPMYILRGRLPRTTQWVMYAVAGLSILALLAHVVTLSRQSNLPIVGFALPPAIALALVVIRRGTRPAI